ncbi:unnamed protein product, partial [Chrysoparadoxa australica]
LILQPAEEGNELKQITELSGPGGPVTALRFSPTGAVLAVGSEDKTVHLFGTAEKEWAMSGKCAAMGGAVISIDFTADGAWLRANSDALDMAVFNAETGETAAEGYAALRGEDGQALIEWASATCTMTYGTQGVEAGITSADVLKGEVPLLVTGENCGRVILYKFPCLTEAPDGSSSSSFTAHAGPVGAISLSGEGSHCISTGSADRCICQWTVEVDEGEESGEDLPHHPADGSEEEAEEELEEGEEAVPKSEPDSEAEEDFLDGDCVLMSQKVLDRRQADLAVLYAKEDASLDSVKPWLNPISTPTNQAAPAPGTPSDNLHLAWIHGYTAQRSRQNLYYNTQGSMVYPAACVGVVMSKSIDDKHQAYFLEHTNIISCMDMHPGKVLAATGQLGQAPFVCIWDTTTLTTVARIPAAMNKGGISEVCFSSNGLLLAVAYHDAAHTVMVFRWEDGVCVCQGSAGPKKVTALAFDASGVLLLAAGCKYFRVFTIKGSSMTSRRGFFGSGSKVQPIVSALWIPAEEGGAFVMGGADGTILRVEGRKVATASEGHEGPIHAMYLYTGAEGVVLVTGGKDGKVKTWDAELSALGEVDLNGRAYINNTHVRSVCINDHSDCRKVLIGTAGSEILELTIATGIDVNGGTTLVSGHSKHYLWGLTVHPKKQLFATAGDDKYLREWSIDTRAVVRQIYLGEW